MAINLAERVAMIFMKYVFCGYLVMSGLVFGLNILYCVVVDGYMNPVHLFIPYKFS